MIRKIVPVLLLFTLGFSSCTQEDSVYVPITEADIFYNFYSDQFGTTITGEIINDGETFINAVQLEIRLYSIEGFLIDVDYVWVDTYFNPGESVQFLFESGDRNVFDVDLFVFSYD